MWARPLAVRATAGGLQVSSAAPVAAANAVVTPFKPAVTAGGPIDSLQVAGYGAFHVLLRAKLRAGGTVEATVVQGSPVLYLRFEGTAPPLVSPQSTIDGAVVRVSQAGQRWALLTSNGSWRQDGDHLTAPDGRVAVARVPDGVDQSDWDSAIAHAAGDPVVRTTAAMAYDRKAGTVTQTLTAGRESGKAGVWALLPHQQAGLDRSGTGSLAGSYSDPLGKLSLVEASTVRVRVRMPGLLTAAPSVPLSGPARAAVIADLGQDLAAKPGTGGSYFGLKELGRLATIAQVAGGVGAKRQRQQALDRPVATVPADPGRAVTRGR